MNRTPYELFGIECGKGWRSLYQPILDKIKEINESSDDRIEVTQVKEKFGRLEIYLDRYTDELLDMINEASEASGCMCEECGEPAEPSEVGGWIYQLCDKCYDKYLNKTKEILKSYEHQLEQREENIG
jgi:hypothetical protein